MSLTRGEGKQKVPGSPESREQIRGPGSEATIDRESRAELGDAAAELEAWPHQAGHQEKQPLRDPQQVHG